MNLILCIVRKDLRRLRWWLVIWVGVLALPILFGVRMVMGDLAPNLTWRRWEDTAHYLTFLRIFFVFLMTIVVVHEDGLVGDRHAWMTRPIGGRRLLAAKVLTGFLVLVVAPILVCLPWWLWCGFTLTHITSAAIELAALTAGVGVLAAFLAVITDSIPRTLLWTLVLVASVLTAVGMTIVSLKGAMGDTQFTVLRLVVAGATFLLFAAAAVVVQYLQRDRRRVLIVAGAAATILLLLQAAMTAWPSGWVASSVPRTANPERASDVAVTFDSALRWEDVAAGAQSKLDQIHSYFTASGVPEGLFLAGIRADHLWTWDNLRIEQTWSLGTGGPFRSFGLKHPYPDDDPETARWHMERARLNGRNYTRGTEPTGWRVSSRRSLRPSVAKRMTVDPPHYFGRLWFMLTRPTLGFEIPFHPNERGAGAGHSLRLIEVRRDSNSQYTAIETRPFLAVSFLREMMQRVVSFPHEPNATYALLNRQQGEFINAGWPGQSPIVPIYSVAINPRGPVIVRNPVVRDGKWVSRPGWLENATLALVSAKPEAVFYRDVEVERLPVEDQRPNVLGTNRK